MRYFKLKTVVRVAFDLDDHIFSILTYTEDGVDVIYDGPPICYVKLIVRTLVVTKENQTSVGNAINIFLSGTSALIRLF